MLLTRIITFLFCCYITSNDECKFLIIFLAKPLKPNSLIVRLCTGKSHRKSFLVIFYAFFLFAHDLVFTRRCLCTYTCILLTLLNNHAIASLPGVSQLNLCLESSWDVNYKSIEIILLLFGNIH